ncbi:LacI family DNA-binding transcriptional regulator [Lichenihabitans sp. Uapishka_5]|uniref:LacI family DNA-binding transcriptional regulator n=1 Tax=Lichenihabitans sp. Uapishka_5 TaxID=3037302 RepID=UPI0029E7FCB3|nr:LacI family DNA-binding transcriptional regulator [Lichenihabitans sp. Uapishka_5]MDX7953708.1 LacI family DNA-binding transcriptional regulator [Lichenihabitans sp. Uapishka_5]
MDKRLPAQRSVTITDVARAAQVSKATAARALGGYGTVSAAVRDRVLGAAQRLDYRPNALARTMATGRSGTIGVIVGDIENPFFGLAVRGISDRAKQDGFDVLLANSAEDLATEQAAMAVMLSKGVDGLIVAPSQKAERRHLDEVLARGRPLVLLDRDVPGMPVDVVEVDGRSAARLATELLTAAGHRRLCYVTASLAPESGDPTDVVLTSVGNRISGYLEAAKAAAVEPCHAAICFGAVTTQEAQDLLVALLGGPQRPSAILASDSKIALEVFRASKACGLTIPDDLSLVTFDDADWTSAVDPAVTVIAQPTYALGTAAAETLIGRLNDADRPIRRQQLKASPICRASIKRVGGLGSSAVLEQVSDHV